MWFLQLDAAPNKMAALNAIHLDSEGQIHATGYFSDRLSINNYELAGENAKNFLYIKTDQEGVIIDAKTDNKAESSEPGKAVLTDDEQNIYALSEHNIYKYNSAGELLWQKNTDHILNDFVLLGSKLFYTGSLIGESGTLGGLDYTTDGTDQEFFFAATDLNGNFQFIELPTHEDFEYNQTSHLNQGYKLTTDKQKNIYMSGVYKYNTILAGNTLTNYNNYSYFLAKFDTLGVAHWIKQLNDNYIYSRTVPVTTNEEDLITVTYANIIKSFDPNGKLRYINDTLKYVPQAIERININGDLISVGTKDGGLYISEINYYFKQNNLVEFSNNTATAFIGSTQTDSIGNLYVYGSCSSPIDYHSQTIAAGVFIAKHDVDGNLEWVQSIPGAKINSMPIGQTLALTQNQKNLYIAGWFTKDVTLPDDKTLLADSDGSIFLLKFNNEGKVQNSKQIDGINPNGIDLDVDFADDVLFTADIGISESLTIGSDTYQSQGSRDIILIKYNSSFGIEWSKLLGGESVEYIGISSIDNEDNIYFTGEFTSEQVQFGDSLVTLTPGKGNIPLVKFDPEGEILWIKFHGGSASESKPWLESYCFPTDIKTLPNGETFIKGWHGDSAIFSDTILNSDHGYYNFFISKFDQDGDALWARSINKSGLGFDYNNMDVDNQGNVYLGAQAVDTVFFQDEKEEHMFIPSGVADVFIAKYGKNGDINWVETINSGSEDVYLSSIAVLNNNNLFVSGGFENYAAIGEHVYHTKSEHGYIASLGNFDFVHQPTDIKLSNDTLNLGSEAGTFIGIFSTDDVDSDDIHQYALAKGDGANDSDNNKFKIIEDSLFLNNNITADVQEKYYIYVQTQDLFENTYKKDFTLHVKKVETSTIKPAIDPFNLYPNPVKDDLIITNTKVIDLEGLLIRIMSLDGRIVYSKSHESNKTISINLNYLVKGTYIISFQSNNKHYQYKIVKL
jgi:hypothetical protein